MAHDKTRLGPTSDNKVTQKCVIPFNESVEKAEFEKALLPIIDGGAPYIIWIIVSIF